MARPPVFPAEEKVRIVLSILAGETTVAEAARRAKVSEQSVGNWKRQFPEAGKSGLAAGKAGPSTREQQLEAEVSELTQALGEAAVELRVWKSPRRAGWALRGPRGDPRRGGHADHEKRCPGTGRTTYTSAWPTRGSPTFPSPKSCQLLDAGHPGRARSRFVFASRQARTGRRG
jgi:transposase